ncbi:MAG: xylanase [Sphingomonadales bacterium BRH_c3]|nr:MAG: xylanase [Sphingomonadales bacterium BRH_c3]
MISRRALISTAAVIGSYAGLAGWTPLRAMEQEEIPLWPGRPPGRGGPTGPEKVGGPGSGYGAVSNISVPRMRVYRPLRPNGSAVLVCGGGGYFRIQLWKESTPAAQWLQERGFTVFELIYRLPNDGWDAGAPFADAQRAMKIIRSRAKEFGLRTDRIGVMGFSAGGHLAGFTALQPERTFYQGADQYEKVSSRPDFSVLLFPVVSLREPFDNTRTRREIIGREPSMDAQREWSLDTHASAEAPPTIIFSAADDPITPPAHGITLFEALRAKGAPAELHIFSEGGHGWGVGTPDQIISQWPSLFAKWFNTIFRQDSGEK